MFEDWVIHQSHINLLVLGGFWVYLITRRT